MEYVSTQNFMRCASKQCRNNYQIHSWTINAVLMTLEANKYLNLISNRGVLFYMLSRSISIFIWPPLLLRSTQMSVYYISPIFFSPGLF